MSKIIRVASSVAGSKILRVTTQRTTIINEGDAGKALVVSGIVSSTMDLSGGDFTTVDFVDTDDQVSFSAPRAVFPPGVKVVTLAGDDVGTVWEITGSGPCIDRGTITAGQTVGVGSPSAPTLLIGTNDAIAGAFPDPTVQATALVRPDSEVPMWVDHFVRPTVIFSRMHFGGEPAWPDGPPVTDAVEHTTGAVNLPLYDDDFVSTHGALILIDDHGEPTGDPFPVEDPPRPIIDGIPWNGGTILLIDQSDWENNGPWYLAWDGDTEQWVASRPTMLNGWVTDDMAVEGMPFWVGSGNEHRLRVGVWQFNGVAPSDPGHTWAFHRNEADDTLFHPAEPGHWDDDHPHLVSSAIDELAARVAAQEASGGGTRLVSSETFASGPAGIEVDGLDELSAWRVVIHGACSHTTAGERRLRWRANDDTTENAHTGAVAGRSGAANALTEMTGDHVEWRRGPQNANGVGWGRITLEHTPSPSGRPQVVAGTMHGTGDGGGAGVVNATGMWAGAGAIESLTLWWDDGQWMNGTTVEVWEVPSA